MFSLPSTRPDFVIEDEQFVDSHGAELDQLEPDLAGVEPRVSRRGPRPLTIVCVVLAIVAGPSWVVVRDSFFHSPDQNACAAHGSAGA